MFVGKQKLAPLSDYGRLLTQVKDRIRHAQARAVFAANAELIRLYWDIGRLLAERQSRKGWGAGVLDRLSVDLRNELPEVKGFSRRNLFLMVQFFHEYPDLASIVQPPVAQLPAGPGPKPLRPFPQSPAGPAPPEATIYRL
jgi:predicted nuclease of restriction endonuclease-like (RecB) superfamily